jgi:hypothetical protein
MQRKNDRRQQKNQKKMQMIQQRSKFQLMNNRLYKLLKKKSSQDAKVSNTRQ